MRLDWWHGHETLGWLEEAHKKAGVRPLTNAEEVVQIAEYLDGSLGRVINEVRRRERTQVPGLPAVTLPSPGRHASIPTQRASPAAADAPIKHI